MPMCPICGDSVPDVAAHLTAVLPKGTTPAAVAAVIVAYRATSLDVEPDAPQSRGQGV
jgi:hypothetical protein